MHFRLLDLGVAALALALLFTFLISRHGGGNPAGTVLANPALSPGVTNPNVTQANIDQTICLSGWTKTVRPPTSYTNALKAKQMAQYGLPGVASDYQEDHLISLELGGNPTDPRNLWPEPYPRASQVDQIENDLNDKICSGAITLAEGQKREARLKHQHG